MENVARNTFMIFADNVATEPVRGEEVGFWQPRRNARIWRRPQFIDGILLLTTNDPEIANKIDHEIKQNQFHILNWVGREGVRVPQYDKNMAKRLAIFRKPRKSRRKV